MPRLPTSPPAGPIPWSISRRRFTRMHSPVPVARRRGRNSGAMLRQGPHQGAHTSSSTGMSLLRRCRSSTCSSTSAGLPVNSRARRAPRRKPGKRFGTGTPWAFSPSGRPGNRAKEDKARALSWTRKGAVAPLTPFLKKSMGSKGLGPWWVQGEALVGAGQRPAQGERHDYFPSPDCPAGRLDPYHIIAY